MKELDLYRFIDDNGVEYHWEDNDVLLFVDVCYINEFNKLLPYTIFDDEGIECYMKHGYIVFKMKEICEYCGIDLGRVFKKEK